MSVSRHELVLPELGVEGRPVTASVWLVARGTRVREGDPVLEVAVGPATVDLPASADGVLVRKLVHEGDLLTVGQRLAIIETDDL